MIIDVRDYSLRPGTRDRFLDRCGTVLFPEQERLGATILGIFRDAADPDRVVWLRGMPDMAERRRILTAFYSDGEMWKAHRSEVNSWIVDSDDVLLVTPISDLAAPATGPSIVTMASRLTRDPSAASEGHDDVAGAIRAAGGRLLVKLATDPSPNNYPRHPIRTGEFGFLWLATFEPGPHRPLGLPSVTERTLLPTEHSWLR